MNQFGGFWDSGWIGLGSALFTFCLRYARLYSAQYIIITALARCSR